MKQELKAAIYARVSTDDKGQDPLNQLLQLRDFAAKQGWVIVQEYTDEMSARNGDRKGFKEMWKDAARHRFDVLLFWSLDRLTREGTLATLNYLRRLKDRRITGSHSRATPNSTSILWAYSVMRSSASSEPSHNRSASGSATAPRQA
jgi:DNA invertase Pin-like site-specific DNA recombinase